MDPLDPQALPRLVAGFDVGLICTRPCSWLAEGHPKELLPFLAAGRPVVSTAVPEVFRVAGTTVSFAADVEGFAYAIRRELASDEPARRPARIERAAAWGWSRFEARLAAALPAPPAGGGAWTEVEFAKFVRASIKPPVEGATPPLNPPDRDLALHFAIMQSQLGRLGVA